MLRYLILTAVAAATVRCSGPKSGNEAPPGPVLPPAGLIADNHIESQAIQKILSKNAKGMIALSEYSDVTEPLQGTVNFLPRRLIYQHKDGSIETLIEGTDDMPVIDAAINLKSKQILAVASHRIEKKYYIYGFDLDGKRLFSETIPFAKGEKAAVCDMNKFSLQVLPFLVQIHPVQDHWVLAGRDTEGFIYAQTFSIEGNKIKSGDPKLIDDGCLGPLIGYISGTADIFSQSVRMVMFESAVNQNGDLFLSSTSFSRTKTEWNWNIVKYNPDTKSMLKVDLGNQKDVQLLSPNSTLAMVVDDLGLTLLGRTPIENGRWLPAALRLSSSDLSKKWEKSYDVTRSGAFLAGVAQYDSLYLTGTFNYDQNPQGMSVSGPAAPLYAQVDIETGEAVEVKSLPYKGRYNEGRSIMIGDGDALWIGGMRQGPWTHSADDDFHEYYVNGFTSLMSPLLRH